MAEQATPQQPAAAPAQTPAQVRAEKEALGPNASSEGVDTKDSYFEVADGEGGFRKVNAWNEEKGSAEDKKRMATL